MATASETTAILRPPAEVRRETPHEVLAILPLSDTALMRQHAGMTSTEARWVRAVLAERGRTIRKMERNPDTIMKRWVLVASPGRPPERKGPYSSPAALMEGVQMAVRAAPEAVVFVLMLTTDQDLVTYEANEYLGAAQRVREAA